LYTISKAGEHGSTHRVEEGSNPLACFIDKTFGSVQYPQGLKGVFRVLFDPSFIRPVGAPINLV